MSAGLREVERGSIRAFVQRCADQGLLSGRVLDYGCGWFPYRDIVESAGGDYWGHDRANYPGSVVGNGPQGNVYHMDWDPWADEDGWDAILCTQVLQYVPDPGDLLRVMRLVLAGEWILPYHRTEPVKRTGGYLVATGPTNWPQCEAADLHRHTLPGIERLLEEAEFIHIEAEYRAEVVFEGEKWPLGWAAVARA